MRHESKKKIIEKQVLKAIAKYLHHETNNKGKENYIYPR